MKQLIDIKFSLTIDILVELSIMLLISCCYFNRFGRRKTIGVTFLLAAVGAIGTLLLSDKAENDKGEALTN